MLEVPKKQLTVVLVIFVVLALTTYVYRYPTGDDAWLGEQAFWLEKGGIIRSEFFRGLVGCEKQIFVCHKLFLIFGALMIRLFGYELPVLQFVGLIFFIVLICELVYYIGKREGSFASPYIPALLILIFSNRLLIKMSFENRPEMMVAALGFASFLCLTRSRITISQALGAGFLAGLAFLGHMNGIIYLIAGFVTLIYLKQYKPAAWFAAAGGLTSLTYFLDVWSIQNGFSLWLAQFSGDPQTVAALKGTAKLTQILTYPLLFFKSPEQIALSLLLVFLIWSQRALLKNLPAKPKVYALVMFLSFWTITKANVGLYMLIFIPFMLVLVYELYKLRPFRNLPFRLVIATYFIIGAFGMCQIIYANLTMEYLPVSYEKLRNRIDDNDTGFVPLTFFFDEYEAYPRLLTHENYELQSGKRNMTTKHMANWARKNNVGFILMDYAFRPESYYPKAGTKSIPFYKLTYFNGRFAIYER
ncbi:hypothetical protein DYBT9623_04773 [Dyadobacter sp. CECT 9623]|uniref:Glycosyltransferase RgtA/B/C/D-like domain-containing protein n=1 Tax=Dyadobacter linearis TaxID=2823330 RepID=A0ABM8UWS7_9BACT|nr:hypothetical protein [Dyadobacter sp. CECT 9623]CAG5073307.1 hypothetical protein DYBT9623_04773 [Dyadobacter sp. CECT 9623]